jgi:hypothetical protein
MRTLSMPKTAEPWLLTNLREKLIKIGATVVSHGRYVTFQMAEVEVPRQMFQEILSLIAQLRAPPVPARPGKMRQTATAEVRLDIAKRQAPALRGRASRHFGCQRAGCHRISLRRNPQGRRIRSNGPGIRRMSVFRKKI